MRVPGWKTARRAGRWARSRLTGTALILGYHRIAEPRRDPFGLCVSPRHFAEHMEVLRRAARPRELPAIVQDLRQRGDTEHGSVAVTFDDGYADFARHAEPVLQKNAVPASVFAVSGLLGRRPWWDSLAALVMDAPEGASSLAALAAEAGSPPPAAAASVAPEERLGTWHRWLLGMRGQQRQWCVGRLQELDARTGPDDEIMSADQLAAVARSGLVMIGSHTVNHVPLAGVREDEQLFELTESRRTLEAIIGQPVSMASYPHGSYDLVTRRVAHHAGYQLACASAPDAVTRSTDPFCLPRFWVPDCDGDRFSRWLRRWRV